MSVVNFKTQNTYFQQIMHDKWTKVMRYVSKYLFATDRLLSFSLTCTYILICLRYFFSLSCLMFDLYTRNTLHRHIYDGPVTKHCLRQCISKLKLALYLAYNSTIDTQILVDYCNVLLI